MVCSPSACSSEARAAASFSSAGSPSPMCPRTNAATRSPYYFSPSLDLDWAAADASAFNDESTPAGKFVLRLCAEAEARSHEDLKKICKDSKAGSRAKGEGAVRRTAHAAPHGTSSGASPPANTALSATATAALAPAPAGAASHELSGPAQLPVQRFTPDGGAAEDALAPAKLSPANAAHLYAEGMSTRTLLQPRDASGGSDAASAPALTEGVDVSAEASDAGSEMALQQTTNAEPSSAHLDAHAAAALGAPRGPLQAPWSREGSLLGGQGRLRTAAFAASGSLLIACGRVLL
ncbi:uncharacterized protein LOC113147211 [Cyclospora cayetanensis]|uniref:Uncharacterized protein LOC113147211 n=1 Tax=Cyclospora cayetanensis TaxID=88456 RepID=A0A6P6RXZ0_9EIME|nr:uncharacterized protein LOC113147211 [Cyclospora cayetanensis]